MSPRGRRRSEKRWLDDEERAEHLAVLLIREIDRILFDLAFRRELLFSLWSRERLREPLLHVLKSRYRETGAELLLLLPSDVYQLVDDFYRALDGFWFYAAYTEDMPDKLSQRFDAHVEDLRALAPALIERLQALAKTPVELVWTSAGPT